MTTDTGIFVWGGCCDSARNIFTDGAFYDGDTGEWRVLPAAPLDPRRGDAALAWNGTEVIAINGVDGLNAAAFDPQAFTWRSITPPPVEIATNAESKLHLFADGRLAFVSRMSVSYWDPTPDEWSSPIVESNFVGGSEQTDGIDVIANYAVTPTAIAAITIGADRDCSSTRIRTFDSTTNSWTATAPPETGAFPTEIVGIDNGRFLLSGRFPCEGAPPTVRTATIFDPADGTFTPVADIAWVDLSSRYGGLWNGDLAVWLLYDGRILAYRPATDEWFAGTSLLGASSNSGDLITDTPLVWFDDRIVVVSPGWDRHDGDETNPGGWTCCFPTSESWSTNIPRTPAPTPPPSNTTPDLATQPDWYQAFRPLIPERFEHLALTSVTDSEVTLVAVEPSTGKSLEVRLATGSTETATSTDAGSEDAIGLWTPTPQGHRVVTPAGLRVDVSCNLGVAAGSGAAERAISISRGSASEAAMARSSSPSTSDVVSI